MPPSWYFSQSARPATRDKRGGSGDVVTVCASFGVCEGTYIADSQVFFLKTGTVQKEIPLSSVQTPGRLQQLTPFMSDRKRKRRGGTGGTGEAGEPFVKGKEGRVQKGFHYRDDVML